MTRGLLGLICALCLAACTGPSASYRAPDDRVAAEDTPNDAVRVSGYATFGYIKGR